jgi:hypothetical protein
MRRSQNFQLLVAMLWTSIFTLYLQHTSDAFVTSTRPHNAHRLCDSQPQLQENFLGGRKCVVCKAGSRSATTRKRLEERWFPTQLIVDSECQEGETTDSVKEAIQGKSLRLMARLMPQKLRDGRRGLSTKEAPGAKSNNNNKAYNLARGRFVDLCCTLEGERTLEALFDDEEASNENIHVLQGAIISLQSLVILGTQFGVKGTPEQFEKSVSHLIEPRDDLEMEKDHAEWDASSARRLKYQNELTPGLQLLTELQSKRSAQGAYDLLVKIGAWQKHEDLALLRSGLSTRFSSAELGAADKVSI